MALPAEYGGKAKKPAQVVPDRRPIKDVIKSAQEMMAKGLEAGLNFEGFKVHYEGAHKGKKAVQLAAIQADVQSTIEYIDALHVVLQAEFDAVRMRLLPDAMDEEHLASPLTVAGVGRVTLTPDLQVSIKDQGGFYSWLKKKKLGDIIKPTINSSTLKAFCKTRMADGKELPSEMLNLSPITRASITRAK